MERWLEKIKEQIDFSFWCFGHYHQNRIERPGVEMFYNDICLLDEITLHHDRENYWYLKKGPNYYTEI